MNYYMHNTMHFVNHHIMHHVIYRAMKYVIYASFYALCYTSCYAPYNASHILCIKWCITMFKCPRKDPYICISLEISCGSPEQLMHVVIWTWKDNHEQSFSPYQNQYKQINIFRLPQLINLYYLILYRFSFYYNIISDDFNFYYLGGENSYNLEV